MARWRYRRRRKEWQRWAIPLLVAGLVGAWYLSRPAVRQNDWVEVRTQFGICGERGRPFYCVSDGDTVTIGYGSIARRIRLTGFDAPEIAGSCDAERTKAVLAQRALQDWLNTGPFEWDGGATPPRDQYGRELREARRFMADGTEDRLARHMIDQGLASGDGLWEWREWCK